MIKRILFILLVGLLIAGFGILVMREPGFAVFNYGDTTVEIPLIKFYFAVIALFIFLYFLFRVIGAIFRLPGRIQTKRTNKRHLEIMQAMETSMLDFSQFKWSESIKNSTRHIKHSPMKRAQHLFTAHCAHNTGQFDTRNAHVSSLRKLEGGKALANTIEAEFCLEDGKPEKALTILHDESTENICNLNTLSGAYTKTGNIEELENILPKLLPHSDKSPRIQYTVNRCLHWMINHYDINAADQKLSDMWKVYSKQMQSKQELLNSYVHILIKHNCDILAEQIIKTQLDQNWDESLIQEYGLLKIDDIDKRIKQSENWLSQHKDSAGLLLTLGRLYKNQKLWGKAKSYLESSLSRRPLAATYAELAELHEFLDETADAQRCAKKGLHIATRNIAPYKRRF